MPPTSAVTPEKFTTFGELLRFLRRKADLTQRELSIAVGYSESQISRLEQNERAPEEATLAARFVPALYIDDEQQWVARLLELGTATRSHASDAESMQPIADAKPTPHNLPIQLTSFIGREKEITEIKQLLAKGDGRVRLLTITGPGGCGKIRLALQAASGMLDDFRDGVWLVEFAPLADATLVSQTVAEVLGLKEEPGRAILSTLTDHLRGRKLLLILDNCEHLIQANARLSEALLRICPDLCILATSRELLGVAAERSFHVPPLSTPDMRMTMTPEAMVNYEAVRLFIERAVTVMPNFILTNENTPAVAQVCEQLDGIPLAIELAAARVTTLRIEQIAARLDDAFHLLTGGTRTALPRQQTLQAALDWSYDLLTEAEQHLFNRLSVFAGGWTLEAAEGVCAGEGIESTEILDLLVQLVNKSLVLAEREQGEETRYRFLEIIRQYVLAKLVTSGDPDAVRQRHAEYYLALVEATAHLSAVRWDDRYQAELDNLRAALTWSYSAPDGAELGLRLASGMLDGVFNSMEFSELQGWLEGVLAHSEAERVDYPQAQARVLLARAYGLGQHSDFVAAEARLTHSLMLFQALGDRRGSAEVIYQLGWIAREQGDTTKARLRLEESLALWRELGHESYIASTLLNLGEVAVMQEDTAQATALLEESLALHRLLGDSQGIGWGLNHLGHVAQLQCEYKRAVQLHEECLVELRRFDPKYHGLPEASHSVGEAALAWGDTALATKCFSESLKLPRYLQEPKLQAWCLAGLAGVAALNEEPQRAAWLWGAAEALRQSIGARPAPAARATHERLKAEVRKQLGDETFNAKWAEGQAVSVEQAIDEATR